MVATIDGPAGVGKSSVAKRAAKASAFLYVNSGSFYRAITLAVLERGGDPGDARLVLAAARACRLDMHEGRVRMNGRDVEDQIRSPEIDSWVAPHSSIPEVRDIVNARLREVASRNDVIVEGRDIGTVVFPHAEVKVFLDADVRTRALRRHGQGLSSLPLQEVERGIAARDGVDMAKPKGRLEPAPDSIRIDTTHLTIDQVCERVLRAILEKKNNPGDICRL